jgi:uncharacterized protein YcbX
VQVLELWRYPVKSLQGERLQSAELGVQGIEGDRRHAIFDAATGFGLTARRVPELLFGAARYSATGEIEIVLPDGTLARDDATLSSWLGRPVVLRSTSEVGERQYENVDDFEHEGDAPWHPFDGSLGSFRDSERTAISLVSEGTLAGWDRRRFRSNVVLSGSGEDSLVGSRVALGGAIVEITKRVGRCVMVTRAQPGGIEKDLDVLRTIHRERGGMLAIGAMVMLGGPLTVGDELIAGAVPGVRPL